MATTLWYNWIELCGKKDWNQPTILLVGLVLVDSLVQEDDLIKLHILQNKVIYAATNGNMASGTFAKARLLCFALLRAFHWPQ